MPFPVQQLLTDPHKPITVQRGQSVQEALKLMLIEDIERTLRDFILVSLPNALSDPDDPQLKKAIQQAVAPPHDRDLYKKSIRKYLESNGEAKPVLNGKAADEAYAILIGENRE